MPTCSFITDIDTSSAHLVGDTLTIPDGGLSFLTDSFAEIYASALPQALRMISKERQLGLSFFPNEAEACQNFHFFSKAFSQHPEPAHFHLSAPEEPSLCPCCIDVAQFRVRQLAQNPLTAILAHAASSETSLVVSAENHDGLLTIAHTPVNLLRQDENLISEGTDDQLKISIRHLHAMRLTEETLDGVPHQSLALLNSHGDITCTLSAPSAKIATAWQDVLGRKDNCYQIHESRKSPS